MAIPVDNRTQALGTPDAALDACVELIASVTGQSRGTTERFLDLYYQVRSSAAASAEKNATPPADEKPVAAWTRYKVRQAERLKAARAAGVTFERLVRKTNDYVTMDELISACNAGKLPRETWRAIELALDGIEKETSS